MHSRLSKLASLLALAIGAMAVFAGGKVLLGQDPGYYVIDWLPVYNFMVGVISILVTSVLIWRGHRFALPAVLGTLLAHNTVMAILLTVYGSVVASDSLRAMTLRISVWTIISLLVWMQARRDRPCPLAHGL
jgi:hypothetical protein